MSKPKTSYAVPEEIWYEILKRLPSKPLCSSRSVSKQWDRLIRCPEFISSHLAHTLSTKTNTHMFLVCPKKSKPDSQRRVLTFNNNLGIYKFLDVPFFLEKPDKLLRKNCRILGSCSSLVCLVSGQVVVLWNPSVKRYVRLPPCSVHGLGDNGAFGFGVNLLSGDFKVVSVVLREEKLPLIQVYSLRRREWERVEFQGDFHYPCRLSETQLYMNGRSHWISMLVGDEPEGFVVSFDLGEEVFREVRVPEQLARVKSNNLKLVRVSLRKECLGIAVDGTGSIGIWVMEEYGVFESWSNLYSISDISLGCLGKLRFVGFMENGNILVRGKEREEGSSQLIIHDPYHKLTYKSGISCSQLYTHKYVESLVLFEDNPISEDWDWLW